MATDADTSAAGRSPRDKIYAVLEAQPADSTYDQLLNALVINRAIDRGLSDVDAGRVVSHEEAIKRIRSWRK